MNVYVIGSSAVWFWRHANHNESSYPFITQRPLSDCPTSIGALASLDHILKAFGPMPVRLLVPSTSLRISARRYSYSISSGAISKRAFRQVTDGVCVASPELCLMQYATKATRAQLMEMCMEFCGFYALEKGDSRGFKTRDSRLCSVDSLVDFAREMSWMPGSKKLLIVAKYMEDGSRSPMEARTYLLSCLPRQYGGYGLPRAQINARVELTPDCRRYSQRAFFECDMHWSKQKVVIEYDGHDYHESRDDRARDAAKRNTLLALGYSVFTFTSQQVCNALAFDKVMKDVAHALAYKISSPPPDWERRRQSLRRELFRSCSR